MKSKTSIPIEKAIYAMYCYNHKLGSIDLNYESKQSWLFDHKNCRIAGGNKN